MAEAETSNPTFESAMARLQQIVEQMESDQFPLEEMLERYEEGIRLVQVCSEKLASAEKRIEIITRTASGKPRIAEFDATTPTAPPAASAASGTKPAKPSPGAKPASDPDDISLF